MGDGHGSSSPYASGAFTYRYGAHGTVSIGASYFLYTSDQYGFRTAETIASYLQLSHAITTKLTGRIGVSFIHSELNDPDFTIPPGTPTPSEDAWRVAVGATYAFTRWLYLDANYEFLYSSGVMGSGFDRNRVWAGIRVTY
jgi:long-subunit fatty acid transport protein